jgi:patatin-related protein
VTGPVTGVENTAAERFADTQDIRLAVVLNGGVSLAVWISGVTHELNSLVQAGRRRGTENAPPDAYAKLLDVLQADVRIDVISGTSAGGINGGFLALGLVHGCNLAGLRDLWKDQGSLSTLLRNPRDKAPPSLLRGKYFHDELAKAYRKVWDDTPGVKAPHDEDVDLFLTGTLWDGRRSFFADDMGRRITETDYDATFHFTSDPEIVAASEESTDCGDLFRRDVTAELAGASRCTASFPGAFEPWVVNVPGDDHKEHAGQQPDGRWPSDAGRANFQRSQFVIDGGILRNKPIRPAIDAVYRQPAGQQVRRILAYVVPDPGGAATGPGKPHVDGPPPGAGDVLLGVMTRLRSTDSVAEELAEITRRNEQTVHRRRARDQLAQTLVDAATPGTDGVPDLVRSAYPGYLEVRRNDSAQSVARLLLSRPQARPWSQREVATELRDLAGDSDLFPFLPQRDVDAAFGADPQNWRWGQATVRRLGDLVLDVLKRAVWLAPMADERRTAIVEQRRETHLILKDSRDARLDLDRYWREAQLPTRRDQFTASPAELIRLRETLHDLATSWGTSGPQADMGPRLHGLAQRLADRLREAGAALRSIADDTIPAGVDPKGVEQKRLRALVRLLVPDAHTTADVVLRNMLRLEVLHVAFTGVSDVPEQWVELVQVSSLREELVTGVQLHHFGAFYRQSWRANDWLRGRVDGSEQLVQMLLAPERLRQLYGTNVDTVLDELRKVAVGPEGSTQHDALLSGWNVWEPRLMNELQVLKTTGPLPRTFPLTAARISHRIRAEFLAKELGGLAAAVETEPDPVEDAERWARHVRALIPSGKEDETTLLPSQLNDLLQRSEVIGRQTIAMEAGRGSDTFARTATHAGATLTSTAASVTKPRPAALLLKALRGYAMLLWVLVNFLAGKSHVGRNLTSLVLGVGGTLIAVTLVVPGVPIVVPLTGVILLLAAGSASALLGRKEVGWVFAGRIGLLLVLAIAALVLFLAFAAADDKQTLWELLGDVWPELAVVAGVIAVGWYLGRPTKHDPAPAGD